MLTAMPVNTTNRFLLLYGSQTGQAQAISEEIAEKAEHEGLHADVHCLSTMEKKFNIEREKCIVIVTSTTGDGDPPDTAAKFIRRLKKKTLSNSYLSHLHYALLGLGDSNYTNFCKCGKFVEKRLTELGAVQFYNSGWADDAVGLEVVVESWMDGLFPALREFLGITTVTDKCPSTSTDNNCEVSCSTVESNSSSNNSTNNLIQPISSSNGESSPVAMETHTISNLLQTTFITTNSQNDNDKLINSNKTSTLVENSVITTSVSMTTDSKSKEELPKTTSMQDSRLNEEADQSLHHSVPPLSESSLTLPFLPPPFLSLVFKPDESVDLSRIPIQNGCPFPSAAGDVVMATVTSAKRLTTQDAVKKTLLLMLDLQGSKLQCEAGDTVSVICPNPTSEVSHLLTRLGMADKANVAVRFEVIANTKKRNASVPSHFPSQTTLQHLLQTCVNIRNPPKKGLLRCLIDFTSDDLEKRRLQELCSKQGAADYATYIREPELSVLDILNAFPSCMPPIQSVIELLPRLQPRPYSICCHPASTGSIQICFNVVTMENVAGRSYPRSGLCTGWLDSLTAANQSDGSAEATGEVIPQMQTLTLEPSIQVPVFARTNQHFRLPEDSKVPVILIGPGTGVAPFIGFLQQRQSLSAKGENCGAIWLFYGCRHKNRDFLFRKELEDFETCGILSKLCVSVSRDDQSAETTRYVQDNIIKHGQAVVTLLDDGAVVYVCGDANNMAKDVNAAFSTILQKHKNLNEADTTRYLMTMRLRKKYVEDVWT